MSKASSRVFSKFPILSLKPTPQVLVNRLTIRGPGPGQSSLVFFFGLQKKVEQLTMENGVLKILGMWKMDENGMILEDELFCHDFCRHSFRFLLTSGDVLTSKILVHGFLALPFDCLN